MDDVSTAKLRFDSIHGRFHSDGGQLNTLLPPVHASRSCWIIVCCFYYCIYASRLYYMTYNTRTKKLLTMTSCKLSVITSMTPTTIWRSVTSIQPPAWRQSMWRSMMTSIQPPAWRQPRYDVALWRQSNPVLVTSSSLLLLSNVQKANPAKTQLLQGTFIMYHYRGTWWPSGSRHVWRVWVTGL
jgi:hypothetical protein